MGYTNAKPLAKVTVPLTIEHSYEDFVRDFDQLEGRRILSKSKDINTISTKYIKHQHREEESMDPANDVREFIVENFLFGEEDQIELETNFFEKGIIESTGVIEIVSFIEETFGISIDDEELILES